MLGNLKIKELRSRMPSTKQHLSSYLKEVLWLLLLSSSKSRMPTLWRYNKAISQLLSFFLELTLLVFLISSSFSVNSNVYLLLPNDQKRKNQEIRHFKLGFAERVNPSAASSKWRRPLNTHHRLNGRSQATSARSTPLYKIKHILLHVVHWIK